MNIASTSIADEFARRLRAAGLRVTAPRLAILAVLRGRKVPIAIEELYGALAPERCDLVTVYRALEAFEEAGLVRRYFAPKGTALFVLSSAPGQFVVTDHGAEPIDLDEQQSLALKAQMEALEETLRRAGYKGVSSVIQFFGKAPGATR